MNNINDNNNNVFYILWHLSENKKNDSKQKQKKNLIQNKFVFL